MSVNIKTQEDNILVLSSVRALLGAVTPHLRSVSVELRETNIVWQCIFDTDATEDDLELLSAAAAEVIADFSDYVIEEVIRKVPYPQKTSYLKNLVYLRHEENK